MDYCATCLHGRKPSETEKRDCAYNGWHSRQDEGQGVVLEVVIEGPGDGRSHGQGEGTQAEQETWRKT